MNEGRSQYIGIILISIIVYLLAARFFKSVDAPVDEDVAATEEIQSNDSIESNSSNIDTNTIGPATIIILEDGDSVEVDAAAYAAKNRLGAFYPLANGSEEEIVLENELLKIILSSKGAQVKTVELKEFKDC
jgi:YidC/Oxa1 family membrane protein insertase